MGDQDFREFLDDISDCFIVGDFAPWRDRVQFPFSLITRAGPVVLTTEAQLRQNFDYYMMAVRIMRLDQIYRTPVSLDDCNDGSWIATYDTDLLCHGSRATPRYRASALLVEGPRGFMMTSILNARGHHDWTGVAPMSLLQI